MTQPETDGDQCSRGPVPTPKGADTRDAATSGELVLKMFHDCQVFAGWTGVNGGVGTQVDADKFLLRGVHGPAKNHCGRSFSTSLVVPETGAPMLSVPLRGERW